MCYPTLCIFIADLLEAADICCVRINWKSEHPCISCMVPGCKQQDVGTKFPLRKERDMIEVFKRAENASDATSANRICKEQSIHLQKVTCPTFRATRQAHRHIGTHIGTPYSLHYWSHNCCEYVLCCTPGCCWLNIIWPSELCGVLPVAELGSFLLQWAQQFWCMHEHARHQTHLSKPGKQVTAFFAPTAT